MKKIFPIEGLENLEIEIDQSLWTGKTKIYSNGEPITKRKQDKYYEIKMEDGSIKKLIIKRTSFDPIPRIYIDKQEIKLARNLRV